MSLRRLILLPAVLLAVSLAAVAATPTPGERAPDFTLSTLDGSPVSLGKLAHNGPVVLILLRGYPGYQCPFSQQQFQSYAQSAALFAASGTQVLFVYPGAATKDLASDAANMVGSTALPANISLVLDPGYTFTNLYGLRWDAPEQTAHPSTFVINPGRSVFFAHIGQSASDLIPVADSLAILAADNANLK